MSEKTLSAPTIRELMPPGFTRIIRQRTACKQRSAISDLVTIEDTGSKYWPAVQALAQETNPEGFAQWQAAKAAQQAA